MNIFLYGPVLASFCIYLWVHWLQLIGFMMFILCTMSWL